MTSGNDPLVFTQIMSGLDLMRQFAQTAADKGAASHLASWIAPTVSTEELDKRIADLKTVQFWLEQHTQGIRSMVQALEVQKMTLAALQSMNLNLGDLAQAFAVPAQPAEKVSADTQQPAPSAPEQDTAAAAQQPVPGAPDPLQWWGALTQQFQTIAASALRDAAQAAQPADPALTARPTRKPVARREPAAKKTAPKKATPRKRAA